MRNRIPRDAQAKRLFRNCSTSKLCVCYWASRSGFASLCLFVLLVGVIGAEDPAKKESKSQAAANREVELVGDEQFDGLLRGTEELLVVTFANNWSKPCRSFEPVVRDLAAENPDVRFARVDVDKAPRTTVRMGVRAVPLVLIFKSGTVVRRLVGTETKTRLQALIDQAKDAPISAAKPTRVPAQSVEQARATHRDSDSTLKRSDGGTSDVDLLAMRLFFGQKKQVENPEDRRYDDVYHDKLYLQVYPEAEVRKKKESQDEYKFVWRLFGPVKNHGPEEYLDGQDLECIRKVDVSNEPIKLIPTSGWFGKGAATLGTYRIELYCNNEKLGEKQFRIRSSIAYTIRESSKPASRPRTAREPDWKKLATEERIQFREVKFYNSSGQAIPPEKRQYKTRFAKSEVEFIFPVIVVTNPLADKALDDTYKTHYFYRLSVHYINGEDKIVRAFRDSILVLPDKKWAESNCKRSSGWRKGTAPVGNYKVRVILGDKLFGNDAELLGEGSFEIYDDEQE